MNADNLPYITAEARDALIELIKTWPTAGRCSACNQFTLSSRYCGHFKAAVPQTFIDSGKLCPEFKAKEEKKKPDQTWVDSSGFDDDIPF